MLLETVKSVFKRRPPQSKERGPERGPEDRTTNRLGHPPDGVGVGTETSRSWSAPGGAGIQEPPGINFFQNSHNMILENPTMSAQLIQHFESGNIIIERLERSGIPDAEINSSARQPPPRCHPETRMDLRRRITLWLTNPNRDRPMFWILGPAGVGKSAVAQTIGEYCEIHRRLGAAFFFSRLGHRDDPLRVIPTLAYQFAVRDPAYKRLITQCLADDPRLLKKDLRSQFWEFIIKPFKSLKGQGSLDIQHPLVVIIDGLDECEGEEAQCELVELISECTRVVDNLLWIVCSRPEWHFRRMLSRADFKIKCQREELSVDDTEAQKDVYLFLKDGFDEIRQRFSDSLDAPWPPEAHLQEIATRASGLFIFASTLLVFIGSKVYGPPDANLHFCLGIIRETVASAKTNPFHALDLLYRQILSKIPPLSLPTAMRIFGLCVLYPIGYLTVCDICNLLGVDRGSFYSAFMPLPAVLHVPDKYEATTSALRFYHASFGDFLRNPHRSGDFALDINKARVDIATHLLRWHNFFHNDNCELTGERSCLVKSPRISWTYPDGLVPSFKSIKVFCSTSCWGLFHYLHDVDADPGLMMEADQFRFCHLKPPQTSFLTFVRWFLLKGPAAGQFVENPGTKSITEVAPSQEGTSSVRNWTAGETDRELVDGEVPWAKAISTSDTARGFFSSHFSTHSDHSRANEVFLIGRGDFRCLVETMPTEVMDLT